MHTLPMDRWYIRRWILPATARDFADAVNQLRRDMEDLSGDKYDLKIKFFRAATMPPADAPRARPESETGMIPTFKALTRKAWHESDMVEAHLDVKRTAGDTTPRMFESAVITAKWPDFRQISFEVKSEADSDKICRKFLNGNFTLWTRGIEPSY